MDKFPTWYKTLTLTEEQMDNLNSHIATNQIESVQKYAPTKETPGLVGFTGEFSQKI